MDISQFMRKGHMTARAAFSILLLGAWATTAAAQNCDCSCEAYSKLMSAVEKYKAAQDAGESPGVPPEMMQMSQCAGQCAMRWAQCANPNLDVERLQRAQERADGYSGDDAIARERAINQRSIGETEKNMQEKAGLPKDRLEAEYLQGTWCSVYGGQEITQWQFDADGGYRIGVPAGNEYAMQPEIRDMDQFMRRFETLIEHEQDTFTTEHDHGRRNVFTRGPCS